MITKRPLFLLNICLVYSSLTFAEDDLFNQSIEDLLAIETELKVDVGSRANAENYLKSLSPVDVITYKQINQSGLTSLTDILSHFIAGFNAPINSVHDGSDHIRTFTLRGMSPDQILVLVNGKRLHTSALLNVNGGIGRGVSNVDLDTLIVSSIETIEILRDGAAAQYGSDAISGVINIKLKGLDYQDNIHYSTRIYAKGDGIQHQIEGFKSMALKYDGFINFSASAKKQNKTQRAGTDNRLTPARVETHYGIPDSTNYLVAFNAEVPQKNNLMFYAHGHVNQRNSEASAFFRTPDDSRALFPQGFLPIIQADITDYTIAAGINGLIFENIKWDFSNSYGSNRFKFATKNTLNYSLGVDSPTAFNNGRLELGQNTTRLDFKKIFTHYQLAAGAEYRYEYYKIQQGEFNSYMGSASQGFAGFRPENAINKSRQSYALYGELKYNLSANLLLNAAIRFEDFTDFGSTTNTKLALGYQITPKVLLRTSASTGFRAPSLAQSHYSQTSSFIDNSTNTVVTKGTFTVDNPLSIALGAKNLKAEKSYHFTIGSVLQATKNISLTLDYYYTFVNGRIMLSDDLIGLTPKQIDILSNNAVASARFFTNAIDTETQGIDIRYKHQHTFKNMSHFSFTAGYNYNINTVKHYNSEMITLSNSYQQINQLENGQPKSSLRFLTAYQLDKMEFTLGLSYFGSYQHVLNDIAYKFNDAWLTDIGFGYNFTKDIKLSVNGNNIFNIYPNKWKDLKGTVFGNNGILPYSQYSPFGYSGAYYSLNLNINI